MLTLYNVTSTDRYIADKEGKEDFIPDELWEDFLILCEKYEMIIIGENTYDTIQSFDEFMISSFENLEIVKTVVTRDENWTPKTGYLVVHSIEDALKGFSNILLTSGPSLNSAFLRNRLIDKIILNILPIELKEGVFQFESDVNLNLELISETVPPGNPPRVMKAYRVLY